MKAKVIRAYIDKDTKKAHKVGEVVDLNETRFNELKNKEFIVEDTKDQKAEVEALKKENASLKAKVAELTAIIEKAASK